MQAIDRRASIHALFNFMRAIQHRAELRHVGEQLARARQVLAPRALSSQTTSSTPSSCGASVSTSSVSSTGGRSSSTSRSAYRLRSSWRNATHALRCERLRAATPTALDGDHAQALAAFRTPQTSSTSISPRSTLSTPLPSGMPNNCRDRAGADPCRPAGWSGSAPPRARATD